jgi:hypothetical protein
VFGYQFIGGGTAYVPMELFETPTGTTSNVSAYSTEWAGYPAKAVSFDTPASPCPDFCALSGLAVVGTDAASLSPSNYVLAADSYRGCPSVNVLFTRQGATYNGIPPGTKVYIKTYVMAWGSKPYYDPTVDRNIYTAVSSSAATPYSIVLP